MADTDEFNAGQGNSAYGGATYHLGVMKERVYKGKTYRIKIRIAGAWQGKPVVAIAVSCSHAQRHRQQYHSTASLVQMPCPALDGGQSASGVPPSSQTAAID
jgi:NAD(P)H-dependent FMN reductase